MTTLEYPTWALVHAALADGERGFLVSQHRNEFDHACYRRGSWLYVLTIRSGEPAVEMGKVSEGNIEWVMGISPRVQARLARRHFPESVMEAAL